MSPILPGEHDSLEGVLALDITAKLRSPKEAHRGQHLCDPTASVQGEIIDL